MRTLAGAVQVAVRMSASISVTLMLMPAMWAVPPTSGAVPTLVNFSGVLSDSNGKPLGGVQGVTFSLYKDQQGGSPLWIETQTVQADRNGRYTVMLGSTTSEGLPANLFVSGEARWLGVQVQEQNEQPRVVLLSVPYALKAGDAQTVGGLPASAFMLAPASPDAGSDVNTGQANGSSSFVSGSEIGRASCRE